jgi:hypothetical protein
MLKQLKVSELYTVRDLLYLKDIFVWPSESHSMANSLGKYVENRLPAKKLYELCDNLSNVVVLGVYPTHFKDLAVDLGWDAPHRLSLVPNPRSKRFNYIRPFYYLSSDKHTLYVCVPPGLAYLKQYTSLIWYFFSSLEKEPKFSIHYFPVAAEKLVNWTGLAIEKFSRESVCVLGHVDEFEQSVPEIKGRIKIVADNQYFTRSSVRLHNDVIIELIGIKFSFWGDIAGRIATQLYREGCREVIYIGKVGALERNIELYKTTITPRSFMLAEHSQVLEQSFTIPNGLADFTRSNTHHVSTPTVMEQGYIQRQALEQFLPTTIDNEIAYMALAAKRFNDKHPSQPVSFSSVSFATDYLRRVREHQLPATFDLSNNRHARALQLKRRAMRSISETLYSYLAAK